MRLSAQNFKASLSVFISLWIAVLACFMGCALPAMAAGHAAKAVPTREMPCQHCDDAPSHPRDGQSGPGGKMSCCPLEVTVASKPDVHVAPDHAAPKFVADELVVAPPFQLVTDGLEPWTEAVPISYSGRETLLQIHLLRI